MWKTASSVAYVCQVPCPRTRTAKLVPSEAALEVWEGILVAVVAAYFGSRA